MPEKTGDDRDKLHLREFIPGAVLWPIRPGEVRAPHRSDELFIFDRSRPDQLGGRDPS